MSMDVPPASIFHLVASLGAAGVGDEGRSIGAW